MNQYYLRVEAVNLTNFIADTQDLSTIRGGSLLLLNAVDELPRKVDGVELVTLSTGASAGLYSFQAPDDNAAKGVRDEVVDCLSQQEELKYATFVVDYQPVPGDSEFAVDLAALIARNRWQQMQSPTVVVDSVTSNLICEKDMVRPATESVPGPGGEPLLVSQSVATRRLAGQQLKQAFYQRQIGRSIQARFVRELEELTSDESKGNLSGKMAVIYLDGNRFGQIKNSVAHSPETWLGFDSLVKRLRREMLSQMLDLMANDTDWQAAEGRYRIETLMWGGDEILWVVPAWKGWEALSHFYTVSSTWKFGDVPLRHSGGLVFCHHHAPIHRITNLAKKLAETAKAMSRDANLFAYEVLESFDHVGRDLDTHRRERSPQPLDPTQVVNPASLILRGEDMTEIHNFARSIREKMPRKQLHNVVANLLLPTRFLDDSSGQAVSINQRRQAREERADQLKGSLKQAGVSSEMLEHLAERLGGQDSSWLHLNALWDYLTQE